MKKLLLVALCVIFAVVLVACDGNGSEKTTTAAEAVTTEADTQTATAAEATTDEVTTEEATTEEATTEEATTEEITTEEVTTEREVIVGVYDKYDLDTCMTPIWDGRVVHNETVMFIDIGDKVNLLYPADEILSVRSPDLKTEYTKGVDYDYVDGQLVLLEGTSINYIGTDRYYSSGDAAYLQTKREGKTSPMYFSEKIYKFQVAVTYTHNAYWGDKFIATTETEQFARLVDKLQKGEDVTMIYYGDSITYGASASGMGNEAPYMPTWAEMVTMYIAEQYEYTVKYVNTKLTSVWLGQKQDSVYGTKGTITYINAAVGGWNSADGYNKYDTYIRPFIEQYGCDFFLLGFGMNDGGNTQSGESKAIKKITELIYGQAPDTELALLATMVPNPDTTNGWYAHQEQFEAVFYKLAENYQKAGKHCAVIPMTSMSLSILTVKNFRDYTGNNVNHPNDFFARVYAQTIFQTVIGYDTIKK